MYKSLAAFQQNIGSIRELASLHAYLLDHLKPMSFDDLLRFEIVYAVSALDKLIHDLIRIGMIEIFMGVRPPTAKYLSEKISLSAYGSMSAATVPPKEYYFEQEVISRLRTIAYQAPDKISDGLSYIWDEAHKWQAISKAMEMDKDVVKTQLRLIVDRRNKIVHEADADILSDGKFTISKMDCENTLLFIERCGESIAKLIAL